MAAMALRLPALHTRVAPLEAARRSPSAATAGSARSSFVGAPLKLAVARPAAKQDGAATPQRLVTSMSRRCQLTGKKANNAYVVTFSHKRNKKLQNVNLQWKRVFWREGNRFIRLRLSTKAIKTIDKIGLEALAKKNNIDLASLA
eukprot:jgi/Chlat1/4080/Chrsp26S04119